MHAIETKAQALAAFVTGEPVHTVMADLHIPRSTAWRWWGEARQWLHELGRLHGLSEVLPHWPRRAYRDMLRNDPIGRALPELPDGRVKALPDARRRIPEGCGAPALETRTL